MITVTGYSGDLGSPDASAEALEACAARPGGRTLPAPVDLTGG